MTLYCATPGSGPAGTSTSAGTSMTTGIIVAVAGTVIRGRLVEEVLRRIGAVTLVAETGTCFMKREGRKVTLSSNSLPGRTVLSATRKARFVHVGLESLRGESRLF